MKSVTPLIFWFLFGLTSFSQSLLSDFYVGFGYQISDFNEVNKAVNINSAGPEIDFKELNGLYNLNFGIHLNPVSNSRFYLDISMDYLFHKKQYQQFETTAVFQGVDPFVPVEDQFNSLEKVLYDYSYNFDSYALTIAPSYLLISGERFYMEIGAGIIGYYAKLKQSGFKIYSSATEWQTSPASSMKNEYEIGFDSRLNIGYKIFDKLSITSKLGYRTGVFNDLSDSPSIIYFTNTPHPIETTIFPISETKIDLSGVNLILGLRYDF
jgi:hypothetical protein